MVWPGPPPAGATDDEPAPDQHDRAEELSVHLGLVTDAVRAFNRSVPRAFKCPYPEPLPALDVPVRDGWLEEFFDWVDPIVHSGHGLYLRA